MAIDRIRALCVVAVFTLACVIQPINARAHLRHHRGDSHCSRCPPGWGLLERCGRGRDTLCAECQPGTYSPHHGTQPCWICSRCGPGLYEARRCTSAQDTVCDSCHRRGPPQNDDYRRKCEGEARLAQGVFLAPEDARNTGEQSELVNEDNRGEDEGSELEREKVLWEDAQAQIKEDEEKTNDVRLE